VKILAVTVCALLLTGRSEPESCWKTVDPLFDAALSKELGSRGVAFRLDQKDGVCVPKNRAIALNDAYRRVNEYSSEVAALASDECEQRALVAWATRENLRYDLLPSTNSDGTPSGKMLIVRSLSAQEVALNHEKLRQELPKIQGCPK
jgi:hypothetical protein